MVVARKNKIIDEKTLSFYTYWGLICLFAAILISSQTGCYLHSDAQQDLAEDIQTRYSLIQPAGDVVLQKLDDDLNQLLGAQKANTELLTDTSETVLVKRNWSQMSTVVDEMRQTLDAQSAKIEIELDKINKKQAALKLQREKLEKSLETTNGALEKLQQKKSLDERLKEAKVIIGATSNSIGSIIPNAENDPFRIRLKNSIDEVIKYLDRLESKETKTEKTYSLLLESLRLGRDIIALQIEAIETEENHNQRLSGLYDAETKLLMQKNFIGQYKAEFDKYKNSLHPRTGKLEDVSQTVQRLSEEANSPDAGKSERAESDLRNLLENFGKFQTLEITVKSRLMDLDLRLKVEEYRRARLLDAVYERQRMVLVSTGLDGVVRYSQGGWRSEDIGRITNIIGTVAQIVIAARVN